MADGNSSLQDDELYLPRTVVNKLIKEIVPNIRVSTDARDLLLNCCTEFIHLLASEASDISEKQMKKVISPEHVVEALTTLGFQEYVPDVKAVHKEYKEQASKHRKRGKSKLDRLGIPEEELARQQQQLFDEARQQQIESEMMNQQRQLQSVQQQDPHSQSQLPVASVAPLAPVVAPTQAPSLATPTTPVTAAIQSTSVGLPTTANNASSQQRPPLPGSSIPPSAAITAASLQATSNLLQQALAMASAQVASAQVDASQQNLLQQSAALQAALAAQKLAPAQSQQLLLLQRQAAASSEANPSLTAASKSTLGQQSMGPAATSQELSVAQMMMTLAQASGRNPTSLDSKNNAAQKLPDFTKNNP